MVRVRRRVGLLALALALVGAAVIAPLAAAQSSSPGAGVERTSSNETYSLDELNDGGMRVPEIHDGWRPIRGDTAAAWVQYYPTGAWVDDSRGSDDWQYLEPGTEVKRNFVVLTLMRLGNTEATEETVKVAYYDKETREVRIDGTNETRTEQYAANVTVDKVSFTATGKGTRVRVPLRPHYDGQKEVTMWLASSPDTARWQYSHSSLKSAQESPADTAGDLAVVVAKVVVIGAVLVIVVGIFARLLNRRALVGPMKGMMWWSLVLGGIQLVGAMMFWDTVANVISTRPELLALELALVGFVQGIEARGLSDTVEAIALRPEIQPAKTATGEEGVSSNGLGFGDARVVTDEQGRHVLVKPGLVRWVTRMLGGRQYLTGSGPIRCDVEVTEGRPEICYYVDPMSEGDIIHRPEPSLGWRLPNPTLTQLGVALGGLYIAGMTTYAAGLGWPLGLVGAGVLVLPAFIDAEVPNAHIDPAPPHMGEAHANSMVLAAEYDAVKTVDEAQDAIIEEQAKRSVAIDRADEERATTLVEETLDHKDDDTNSVRDIVDVVDSVADRLNERMNPDAMDDSEVFPSDD